MGWDGMGWDGMGWDGMEWGEINGMAWGMEALLATYFSVLDSRYIYICMPKL